MDKWTLLLKENITLSLAIFSAYMYICTYQYEVAYLKEFNVADNVVTLDLNTILKDCVHVLSVLILFFVTYFWILSIYSGFSANSPRRKAFATFVAQILAAATATVFFLPFSIKNLCYMALGALGFIVLLYLTLSIVVRLMHKSKPEKTDTQNKRQNEKNQLSNDYISRMTWLSYLISYPLLFCKLIGAGEAYRQIDFAIVQDSCKYAVIRKYGEELICVEVDSNRMPGKKMAIYKLSTGSPLILKHETFGPISTMYLDDNPRLTPKKRGLHR